MKLTSGRLHLQRGQLLIEVIIWVIVVSTFLALMIHTSRLVQPLCDLHEAFQNDRRKLIEKTPTQSRPQAFRPCYR